MAKDFKNNNGGHANLSVPMTTFWSTDLANTREYQNVRIGVYGEKVTLNFAKGFTDNKEQPPVTAHIMMDYESACIVARTLKYIENVRKECYKTGTPYPVWSFKNTLQFTDRETKALRTIGVFEIKTAVSDVTGNNTVYICYSTGTDQFNIALGSVYLKTQCEFSEPSTEDLNDSRFSAFVDQFFSVLMNYPVLLCEQKVLSILMSNFNAIRYKLGIPAKTGNDNGGRYTDSNYRSSAPASIDYNGAPDTGFEGGDEPF